MLSLVKSKYYIIGLLNLVLNIMNLIYISRLYININQNPNKLLFKINISFKYIYIQFLILSYTL